MTEEQLANLRRLADQATTGPWRYASEKEAGDNWLICFGTGRDNCSHYVSHFVTTDHVHAEDLQGDASTDAEFVVAARTGVPALLDALAAMTKRAEAAEAKLARMYDVYASECNDIGGPGRMTCDEWLHHMTDAANWTQEAQP